MSRAAAGPLVVAVLLASSCTTGTGSPGAGAGAAGASGGSPPGTGIGTDNDERAGGPGAELRLRLTGPESVALGEPAEIGLGVTNDGSRSLSVTVTLALESPAGASVAVHEVPLFVPHGDDAGETVVVTPAQWFADQGRYRLIATAATAATAGSAGTSQADASTASATLVVGPPRLTVPEFRDVTAEVGIDAPIPEPDCGQFANGAAWGDIDRDGDLDLVVTRLDEPLHLYRNQLVDPGGGQGFTEQADQAGLGGLDANGASFADYDGDGDLDLFLARASADLLLANDGTGRFEDVTAEAGVAGAPDANGMSAAWADPDGDGDLDLHVTNYMSCTGDWSTEEEIIAQVDYHHDALFRNDGRGGFTDVTDVLEGDPTTRDDGSTEGAGFASAWFDADLDGRVDLYIGNDFVGPSPDHNRLFKNDTSYDEGRWRFGDVSLQSGTGLFMNTMGVAAADVDNDGDFDLALTNIGPTKLLRNQGDGTFVDEPDGAGMARPQQRAGLASITWGIGIGDLNLDGWEDAYLAAGNFMGPYVEGTAPEGTAAESGAAGAVIGDQPNALFVNDGTGRFLDVSSASGAAGVVGAGESKGLAFADYDRDGDLDALVVDQGGHARLLENVTEAPDHHWLQVELVGTTSVTDACGAVVTASTASTTMTRQVSCGSTGVASGSQHAVHFGLGADDEVRELRVHWPSSGEQVVREVAADQHLVLQEVP